MDLSMKIRGSVKINVLCFIIFSPHLNLQWKYFPKDWQSFQKIDTSEFFAMRIFYWMIFITYRLFTCIFPYLSNIFHYDSKKYFCFSFKNGYPTFIVDIPFLIASPNFLSVFHFQPTCYRSLIFCHWILHQTVLSHIYLTVACLLFSNKSLASLTITFMIC